MIRIFACCCLLLLFVIPAVCAAEPDSTGWTSIFDGKTLTGWEANVNNSHRDPKRTGSLYNFVDVTEQLVPDDTWWTQHIIVRGNHIIIKVNDKTVVDFTDEKETYKRGYLALQQHDPKSVVYYK